MFNSFCLAMADSSSSTTNSSSPLQRSSSTSSSSALDDGEGHQLLPSDSEDESPSDQKQNAAQVPDGSADNDVEAEVGSPGEEDDEEMVVGAEDEMTDKNFMKVTYGVQKKVRRVFLPYCDENHSITSMSCDLTFCGRKSKRILPTHNTLLAVGRSKSWVGHMDLPTYRHCLNGLQTTHLS